MVRTGFLLLAVAMLSVASCAYYNIFWMAEKDYRQAIKLGGYEFWDPHSQPPLAGDAKRSVNACIERCGKLLLLYPKSRWADDALLVMGNCFLLKGEHQNALRKYDEILQLYSSSEWVPMAKYMKAYTLIHDGSIQQGTALLREISGDSKHKEIRERAVYLLGRTAQERGDCKQAAESFEAYLADFPKGAKVDNVRLHLADCLLRSGREDEVIEVLDPLRTRQSQQGFQAVLRIGEAYRKMGQNDEAIEILAGLTEQAPEDSVKARAKMETAKTMVARGEPGEAVTVLAEAAEIATANLSELRDEIIYNQGRIYEKDLRDFDAAVTSYDKIASSKSNYGGMAGKRAEALKDVQRFRRALADTVPDAPEDEALSRFMLGEAYLEELGLRDEALEQFRIVADSLTSTEFAPKAMLRTAVLVEADSDSLAEVYLKRVVEMFPGTVHANFARSRLGLPLVTVEVAKPDTMALWEPGVVVGPPVPAALGDSLSMGRPGGPLPAAPDTAAAGRTPAPGPVRPRRTSPGAEVTGFPPTFPALPESGDTGRFWREADSSMTPADTTGQAERLD
jgi:TolA-binding protein